MKSTTKLAFAAAALLAASSAFAQSDGQPDNEWLMKAHVAETQPLASQQDPTATAAPSTASATATAPAPTAAAAASAGDEPFDNSDYNESGDGLP
jgi:negative regulator of sigma E activity